jgi:hypothetical protein
MRHLFSKSTLLLAIALVFSSTTFASTLWIFPSIGPSDLSGSFAGYEANAAAGIQAGYLNIPGTANPAGISGTPTAYAPASGYIPPSALISTDPGFSWLGEANPLSPYNNEHGNSLFFGLAIESLTSKFIMKDVTFTLTIPGVFTTTQFDLSGVQFSGHTVGYSCTTPVPQDLSSPNCTVHNTAGGSDDTTPINFLFTSGIYISDTNGSVSDYRGPAISSAYQLTGASDAISTLQTVPEPGTFALLGLGVALALRFRRKR